MEDKDRMSGDCPRTPQPISRPDSITDWSSSNDFRSLPPRNKMTDKEIIKQLRREGLIGGYIRLQPLRKTRSGNISFYVPLHMIDNKRHSGAVKPPRLLKKMDENGRSEKAFQHIRDRLEEAYRRREQKLQFVESRARSNRTRSKEAVARTEWRRAEIRRRQNEKHENVIKQAEEHAKKEVQEHRMSGHCSDVEMMPSSKRD